MTAFLLNTADQTAPHERWRNSPSITAFRSYSYGGRRIETDGAVLRIKIDRGGAQFAMFFACLFLPLFVLVACIAIPTTAMRVALSVGGGLTGTATFVLIYVLQKHHESLGDYLVIDRGRQIISLPRVGKEFPFSLAARLQQIRGRTVESYRVNTDLNLLVYEGDDLVRYHVMGTPSRFQVERIVSFSGLKFERLDMGRHGNRDGNGGPART